MENHQKQTREMLQRYRFEFATQAQVFSSSEENDNYSEMVEERQTLPKGVFGQRDDSGSVKFYTVQDVGFESDAEKLEFLTYQQLAYLKTIKKCLVFFVVLAIIGLTISALYVFGLLLVLLQ